MEFDTLLQKIEIYLATQKPKHSLAWREEIERRIILRNSNFPEQHIRSVQRELIEEMIETAKRNIRSNFSNYDMQRIKDIVNDALVGWVNKFNGDKGFEGPYLNKCVQSALSKDFDKENPILKKENAIDETGQEILIKNNKPMKVVIRVITKRTDFVEKQEEPDETIQDNQVVPNGNEIEDTVNKIADNQVLEIEEEKQPVKGFDELSRNNRILKENKYDNVRLKIEEEEEREKPIGIKFCINTSRIKSAEIIFRHYQLKDVAASQGSNTAPVITERFIPQQDFINDINKGSNWNGFYTSTRYFKKRHSILKTANEREFMELSVNQLKEGVRAFDKEIKDGHFRQSEKKTTPILSSVAVDKNNELISYCHKGQVVSYSPQGERRTFQKHCEFTLLEEILRAEEDLKRLKGGTLFVTLEPCNKRTYYCSNKDCNKECKHEKVDVKIPCAVRCLESGISQIYIGSYDTNPEVEKKGAEILESGCYSFLLKSGQFYSNETNELKREKEIRAQMLLEEHFNKRGCKLIESSESKKTYRINDGIIVKYFYPDLIEEVCELNGQFLAHYNASKYH